MRAEGTTRTVGVKEGRSHCVICGSSDQVQRHHVGGRFHIVWFTMQLCRRDHDRVTEFLRVSDVDMRFTPDKKLRVIRVLQALVVFMWIILEWYKEQD